MVHGRLVRVERVFESVENHWWTRRNWLTWTPFCRFLQCSKSERYLYIIFPYSSARKPLDLKPTVWKVPPIPSTEYGFPCVMLSLNIYIWGISNQTQVVVPCKNYSGGRCPVRGDINIPIKIKIKYILYFPLPISSIKWQNAYLL